MLKTYTIESAEVLKSKYVNLDPYGLLFAPGDSVVIYKITDAKIEQNPTKVSVNASEVWLSNLADINWAPSQIESTYRTIDGVEFLITPSTATAQGSTYFRSGLYYWIGADKTFVYRMTRNQLRYAAAYKLLEPLDGIPYLGLIKHLDMGEIKFTDSKSLAVKFANKTLLTEPELAIVNGDILIMLEYVRSIAQTNTNGIISLDSDLQTLGIGNIILNNQGISPPADVNITLEPEAQLRLQEAQDYYKLVPQYRKISGTVSYDPDGDYDAQGNLDVGGYRSALHLIARLAMMPIDGDIYALVNHIVFNYSYAKRDIIRSLITTDTPYIFMVNEFRTWWDNLSIIPGTICNLNVMSTYAGEIDIYSRSIDRLLMDKKSIVGLTSKFQLHYVIIPNTTNPVLSAAEGGAIVMNIDQSTDTYPILAIPTVETDLGDGEVSEFNLSNDRALRIYHNIMIYLGASSLNDASVYRDRSVRAVVDAMYDNAVEIANMYTDLNVTVLADFIKYGKATGLYMAAMRLSPSAVVALAQNNINLNPDLYNQLMNVIKIKNAEPSTSTFVSFKLNNGMTETPHMISTPSQKLVRTMASAIGLENGRSVSKPIGTIMECYLRDVEVPDAVMFDEDLNPQYIHYSRPAKVPLPANLERESGSYVTYNTLAQPSINPGSKSYEGMILEIASSSLSRREFATATLISARGSIPTTVNDMPQPRNKVRTKLRGIVPVWVRTRKAIPSYNLFSGASVAESLPAISYGVNKIVSNLASYERQSHKGSFLVNSACYVHARDGNLYDTESTMLVGGIVGDLDRTDISPFLDIPVPEEGLYINTTSDNPVPQRMYGFHASIAHNVLYYANGSQVFTISVVDKNLVSMVSDWNNVPPDRLSIYDIRLSRSLESLIRPQANTYNGYAMPINSNLRLTDKFWYFSQSSNEPDWEAVDEFPQTMQGINWQYIRCGMPSDLIDLDGSKYQAYVPISNFYLPHPALNHIPGSFVLVRPDSGKTGFRFSPEDEMEKVCFNKFYYFISTRAVHSDTSINPIPEGYVAECNKYVISRPGFKESDLSFIDSQTPEEENFLRNMASGVASDSFDAVLPAKGYVKGLDSTTYMGSGDLVEQFDSNASQNYPIYTYKNIDHANNHDFGRD